MKDKTRNNRGVKIDEAEFEASLVEDAVEDVTTAETQVVEPEEAPRLRMEQAPAGPRPPWAGKVLGHFKLLRLIGEGKMGRVIQARDVNLHRIVALKVLCKRLAGIADQKRVNQFLREARAAAQIEHPNVVHIYEINQHDGWWYIAMEILDGGNLGQAIKAAGPLPAARACAFIADAASALAVAHELGIIHRDIKPANLMLTRQGRCKLTDFGLVRLNDPNDPFDFTHKAVGSPLFMAPEVILRKEQTPAIDVYSLGMTLYYALTGNTPYMGESIKEVLHKHVKAPIPDLRKLLSDCSPQLALLVKRMIAKNPASRPSAADVATSLRAESIGSQVVDSGTLSPGASNLLRELIGSGVTEISGGTRFVARSGVWARLGRAMRRRWLLIAAVVVVSLLAGLALGLFSPGRMLNRHGPEPGSLAAYFPPAPDSYGLLPPGARPQTMAGISNRLPAFGWVGKVDISDAAFVASRAGRYFYAVDDPTAALIRADCLVTYRTAAQARGDGKVPTP
jgi:serine/threonine-protein kinase